MMSTTSVTHVKEALLKDWQATSSAETMSDEDFFKLLTAENRKSLDGAMRPPLLAGALHKGNCVLFVGLAALSRSKLDKERQKLILFQFVSGTECVYDRAIRYDNKEIVDLARAWAASLGY